MSYRPVTPMICLYRLASFRIRDWLNSVTCWWAKGCFKEILPPIFFPGVSHLQKKKKNQNHKNVAEWGETAGSTLRPRKREDFTGDILNIDLWWWGTYRKREHWPHFEHRPVVLRYWPKAGTLATFWTSTCGGEVPTADTDLAIPSAENSELEKILAFKHE